MGNTAKIWTEKDGAIDNTYGYNDFLITYQPIMGGIGLNDLDNITQAALEEAKEQVTAGVAPTEKEVEARGMIRDGDILFRYGEGGPLVVRHPIFTDFCSAEEIKPNNIFPMTEDEVRAVAFFSDTAYDAQWCEAAVAGIDKGEERLMMTSWDLSNPEGRAGLEKSLSRIEEAKKGASVADPLGLAKKISDHRLSALKDSLEEKMGLVESVKVKIEKNPVASAVMGVGGLAASLYVGGLLTGRGFTDAPKLDRVPSIIRSVVSSSVTKARPLGAAALRFGSNLSRFLSTPLIFVNVPDPYNPYGNPSPPDA
ncbi:MAG: hypothetical protein HYU99_05320 [Deltaproteobacteria bacterium]|nr:hypothetical protein [Deltaproteobacteria bacterium]